MGRGTFLTWVWFQYSSIKSLFCPLMHNILLSFYEEKVATRLSRAPNRRRCYNIQLKPLLFNNYNSEALTIFIQLGILSVHNNAFTVNSPKKVPFGFC